MTISEAVLTDILCSFLNPTRPWAYCFAYMAGQQKSIRGHFTFFETDLSHVGGVGNYLINSGANPLIYCVMCGRMTKKQKEKVRTLATLDTQLLMDLLHWYITESGHPGFKNCTVPTECPTPVVIEDKETVNNTDDPVDEEVESRYEGATFHFSSSTPTNDTGTCETNEKFTLSMLKQTAPTLLVHGGNYANLRELKLENVCAVQFPWGLGGPKMHKERKNRVSAEECYRYYSRLSLKQMMRANFCLLLNHMMARVRTFSTAITKCKFDDNFAERVSTLELPDLERAAKQCSEGQHAQGMEGSFLRTVSSSCRPVGSSTAAAAFHRREMFAYDDFFGMVGFMLTTTPCDKTTYAVKLICSAGEELTLPALPDPLFYVRDLQEQRVQGLSEVRDPLGDDMREREELRLKYPGACSLAFQHLMKITSDVMIGWNEETQQARKGKGLFNMTIDGWAKADEEQGRKTLHDHWLIWSRELNRCRRRLFSPDGSPNADALDDFKTYVDNIMSASYPGFEITSCCSDICEGKIEELDLQVSECAVCLSSVSTKLVFGFRLADSARCTPRGPLR